jgi:hypothetical protein
MVPASAELRWLLRGDEIVTSRRVLAASSLRAYQPYRMFIQYYSVLILTYESALLTYPQIPCGIPRRIAEIHLSRLFICIERFARGKRPIALEI